MNWAKHICRSPYSPDIKNLSSFVQSCQNTYSPIDQYYETVSNLTKSLKHEVISNDESICALILVGYVSATENYIRELFSELYYAFPEVRNYSLERGTVPISSVLWYRSQDLGKALLEGKSLASSVELKKIFNTYFGLDISKKLDTQLLEHYDKICHLRHCIAHSSSYLGGSNATILSVEKRQHKVKTSIDKTCLHEVTSTMTAIVLTINTEMFNYLVNRWAVEWPKKDSWYPKDKNKLFKTLWRIFYSVTDEKSNNIKEVTSIIKCKNAVEKTY